MPMMPSRTVKHVEQPILEACRTGTPQASADYLVSRFAMRSFLSQSYELELTANDEEEFREVREWENLFHGLIERIMGEDGEGGKWLWLIRQKR